MQSVFLPQQIKLKLKNMNGEQLIKLASGNNVIMLSASARAVEARAKNWLILHQEMSKTHVHILKNTIIGLKRAYFVNLELVGVGYKVTAQNNLLNLTLGHSHDTTISIPPTVVVSVKKAKFILIRGFNYPVLTQFVANLRTLKLPDSYKGKGVRYKNEGLALKEGKKKK